jgi:hypothetical protein
MGIAGNDAQTFERWNGTSWSLVTAPKKPTSGVANLNGIACADSADCWGVGNYRIDVNGFDMNHTLIETLTTNPVIITTSASPIRGGTTSGGSTYVSGSSVTVNAAANTGYIFTSWTENGSVVSTSASYTFTATSDHTLVANFGANMQVTVQTNPAGLTFSVDGTSYASAQTFSWQPGSSHTIATTSLQSGGTGVQYVWMNWSDGGAISHFVAPTTNKIYTATFSTQYYLTMSPGTGGTVSPASGWKNSGSTISIHAMPASGYSFTNWTGSGTGSYSGTNNPASITMGGPITENAAFTQNPVQVTVQTNPAGLTFSVDGTSYASAQTFSWPSGSSHTIATTSLQSGGTGIQYVWMNWSDGGAISHSVAPTTNKIYTANFRTQYYLTMSPGTGGTVSPASGWKNSGATVSITARPATNYTFTNWTGSGTGSYSGTDNPASITMGGPIMETATFIHN